uniref:Secreted protein n=1 Tax=Anguilla anguilla TaxID=7936 RepID=A0A0E9WBZ6_ANGAN
MFLSAVCMKLFCWCSWQTRTYLMLLQRAQDSKFCKSFYFLCTPPMLFSSYCIYDALRKKMEFYLTLHDWFVVKNVCILTLK